MKKTQWFIAAFGRFFDMIQARIWGARITPYGWDPQKTSHPRLDRWCIHPWSNERLWTSTWVDFVGGRLTSWSAYIHWIGFVGENLQETHGFLPSNIGFSCKFFHSMIHVGFQRDYILIGFSFWLISLSYLESWEPIHIFAHGWKSVSTSPRLLWIAPFCSWDLQNTNINILYCISAYCIYMYIYI